MTQSFGSVASAAAATTSAVATPSSTPWSSTSTINVTTDSTGLVTYTVDPSSTDPAGCVISNPSNTSATISATEVDNCVIDVNVAADANYDPSTADPEPAVDFTAAAATTSAVATPSSTPWSSTSTINVTTDSTGLVTYTVDPSSTDPAGCVISNPSNTSATISATEVDNCVIDVNVAADANYDPSTADPEPAVDFTAAAATTSAVATPSSTPWSSTSTINVTTDSTGLVTYTVDPSSTAPGCAASPASATSASVSATGSGSCVIDVNVAADANYLVSTTQAAVTFSSPAGGGGGAGSSAITQASPTTGTVATASSGTFTAGPITVQGNSGPVTFVVTKSSTSLTVSSSGVISTTGVLPGGTFSISGTDSDTHGDTGTWTYTLKVTATVTFSANGGMGAMSAESASAPTALSLNAFVRKGYTFVGWNTSPTGTGVSYANGAQFPFASTTVLFAQWKQGTLPFHTITFVANGGTGRTASEVENAPTAVAANHFTRHGYAFVDWSTTARGKGRTFEPGNTYAFKKSITLYARWRKVVSTPPKPPKPPKTLSHVVTFFANGGTGKMAVESKKNPAALTFDGFRALRLHIRRLEHEARSERNRVREWSHVFLQVLDQSLRAVEEEHAGTPADCWRHHRGAIRCWVDVAHSWFGESATGHRRSGQGERHCSGHAVRLR